MWILCSQDTAIGRSLTDRAECGQSNHMGRLFLVPRFHFSSPISRAHGGEFEFAHCRGSGRRLRELQSMPVEGVVRTEQEPVHEYAIPSRPEQGDRRFGNRLAGFVQHHAADTVHGGSAKVDSRRRSRIRADPRPAIDTRNAR
jgi:hypothetical protein